MTIKALLEAIQDAKITADVVVSDRGRLHPVTKIQASANVVMLICRARPDWEGMDCRPSGAMTLSETISQEKASK